MTTKIPYVRHASFVAYSPDFAPTLGSDLEAEFNALKVTLDNIQTLLALIQRNDGRLGNGVVTIDTLGSDTLKAMGVGATPRGAWVTATAYVAGNLVTSGGSTYIAVLAHTSAALFATDLAAGDWIVFDAGLPAHTHPESEVVNLVADLAAKSLASHTHPESDVVGLVADLATKASTSATWAQANITGLTSALAALMPVAGGTFTGDVTFNTKAIMAGFTDKPTIQATSSGVLTMTWGVAGGRTAVFNADGSVSAADWKIV